MLRDERGQTSVEWVGVIVVVAVLVLAFAGTVPRLGGALTGRVQAVVCQIGGGGCGDGSSGPAHPAARPSSVPSRRPLPARPSGTGRRGTGRLSRPHAVRSPRERALLRELRRRPDLASHRLGVVSDILDLLDPPPGVANMGGRLVPINEAGFKLPLRALAKLFHLSEEVAARVGRYAKRLGVAAEVLVASQRYTGNLAKALQEALPAASRGRVTMAVGVGKDSKGVLRIVVGTSERNGYLRSGVADKLKDAGGATVAKTSSSHAEINVLETMKAMGLKPVTIGAGRPICPECAAAIRQAGGTFASPVK